MALDLDTLAGSVAVFQALAATAAVEENFGHVPAFDAKLPLGDSSRPRIATDVLEIVQASGVACNYGEAEAYSDDDEVARNAADLAHEYLGEDGVEILHRLSRIPRRALIGLLEEHWAMSAATAEEAFEAISPYERIQLHRYGTAFSTWEDRGEAFCAELASAAATWCKVSAAFDLAAGHRPHAVEAAWEVVKAGDSVCAESVGDPVARALKALGWTSADGLLSPPEDLEEAP